MVRIRVALAVLCSLICMTPCVSLPALAGGSRSGRIEEARERMRDNESSSDDHDRGRHGHSDDDDGGSSLLDDDDDCVDCASSEADEASGRLLFYMLFVPFWAPAALADDWLPRRQYGFHSYPYQAGAEGHLRFLPVDEQGRATVPDPHQASVRMLASYERQAENLDGRRVRLTLQSNSRFGLEASITRYTEALGGGQYDALWHYAMFATYAFAVSPRAQFTAGAGVREFRFSAGDRFTHVAFHYGIDFFPQRPLHLWVLGQASVGDSGSSSELETGVGVLLHRFELFGGYRVFRVVGVDFSGPELGIAAWF